MIADLFEIRKSGKYCGKYVNGLFATQFIPKGTITDFRCQKCGFYSKEELARLPKKELDFVMDHEILNLKTGLYSKFCDKRMLYDNHSCNANTLGFKGLGITVKDIKKGEECTSDYRRNGEGPVHFPGGCKCGAENCIEKSTWRPPASKKLRKFWDDEIRTAIKLIPHVKQPLKGKLLKERPELSYLFEAKPAKHIK